MVKRLVLFIVVLAVNAGVVAGGTSASEKAQSSPPTIHKERVSANRVVALQMKRSERPFDPERDTPEIEIEGATALPGERIDFDYSLILRKQDRSEKGEDKSAKNREKSTTIWNKTISVAKYFPDPESIGKIGVLDVKLTKLGAAFLYWRSERCFFVSLRENRDGTWATSIESHIILGADRWIKDDEKPHSGALRKVAGKPGFSITRKDGQEREFKLIDEKIEEHVGDLPPLPNFPWY